MNERTQTRIRIVSAGTLLRVPTSIAWELGEVSLLPNQSTAEKERSSLIPQPVPKISPLHVHRRPLEALDKGDSLERILDITMTPVLALNGGNRRDV